MQLWKMVLRWYLGGMGYVGLELLWRGWSHESMFVVGGICFLLIGEMGRLSLPPGLRVLLCGLLITGMELLSGIFLNLVLGLQLWDYSMLPLNLFGQICPIYALLWQGVAGLALTADRLLGRFLFGERFGEPCRQDLKYASPL